MAKLLRTVILFLGLAVGAVTSLQQAFARQVDLNDPEAMRKLAATVPKLDILGVALGMTPQEVTAALKTGAPNMKVDTLYVRMDKPGASTFERVPHWMIAHTVGPAQHFFQPPPDYSGDVIGVEFTTPPARAVVGKIVREVTFKQTAPVAAQNLIDALRKKYGPGETSAGSGSLVWAVDATGKPVTPPADVVRGCLTTPAEGFPMWSDWLNYDPARDHGNINTTNVVVGNNIASRREGCTAFSIVQGHFLGPESGPPTRSMSRLQVSVQSAKLLYTSAKATHEWLQQQADAITKKQKEDASKQAAPKL